MNNHPLSIFALCVGLSAASGLSGCADDTEGIVAGIRSENPAVREDVVVIARQFDDPVVIEALIEALRDESTEVRNRSVYSLAELNASDAAQPLVALLDEESDPKVRTAIIDALGRIGNDIAVPALIALAEKGSPNDVPLNVIWALGNIGKRSALPLLVTLREKATDPYVVFNANDALRKIR